MAEKEARVHGITTDEFFMYKFKVNACHKRYAHDWTSCLYAHSGESARRRDPNVYKPIPCPESKGGKPCPRGDSCKYAHNDFEYWLHPGRYKTEYCKQGPNCNRKICFFAHRPDELRKAPSVVYTNQGPFLDSETTARNKQKMNGGVTSPWSVLSNRRSSSFNNAADGELSVINDGGLNAIPTTTTVFPCTKHLIGPSSQQASLVSSPIGCLMCPCASPPPPSQSINNFQELRTPFLDFQKQRQDSQRLNNIHSAINAMSLTSTGGGLQSSLSELSPVSSQTSTTPWSAAGAACFPYNNSFASGYPGQYGDSELLTFLQGLQNQSLPQTPRSDTTFPYSWSNDLLNLAQIVSAGMEDQSGLCSSISDGAIYGGHQNPSPIFTSSSVLLSQQNNGNI
eukprot:g6844.t1